MSNKKAKKQIKESNAVLKKEDIRYKDGKLIIEVNGRIKEISNFLIKPLRRIRDIMTGAHQIEICAIVNGCIHSTEIVDACEIEKRYYINRLYGGVCITYPSGGGYKYVLHALKILLMEIDEINSFSKLAWRHLEGRHTFAFGNRVINGDKDYLIDDALKEYSIYGQDTDEVSTFELYLKIFKIAKKKITYPLVCHFLVGVMFALFKEADFEIDHVLYFSGSSGSLKTTLATLVGNVYGRGKSYKHSSFESTVNDLEAFISEIAIVGIIDDLRPSIDPKEAHALEAKAQRIIRNVGDGNARGRLKQDLTRHDKFIPNCAVIMTGELSLHGTSTIARIYEVNMSRDDINFEVLNRVQKNDSVIPTLTINFIEWVASNYEDLCAFISNRSHQLQRELIEELQDDCIHMRKPKILASYLAGLEVFLDYGVSIGALSKKKKAKILDKARKILKKGVIEQNKYMAYNDPINMFFGTIEDLRDTNKVYFGKIGEQCHSPKLIGFEDTKRYYLMPGPSYNQVYRFWQSRGKVFPLGQQDLVNDLYSKGILEVEKDSKGVKSKSYKKKIVWPGQRIRVMCINKLALEEYMNEDTKSIKNPKKELENIMKWVPDRKKSKMKKQSRLLDSDGFNSTNTGWGGEDE